MRAVSSVIRKKPTEELRTERTVHLECDSLAREAEAAAIGGNIALIHIMSSE